MRSGRLRASLLHPAGSQAVQVSAKVCRGSEAEQEPPCKPRDAPQGSGGLRCATNPLVRALLPVTVGSQSS